MPTSAPQRSLAALVHDRRGVVGLYFAIALSTLALLSVAALDLIRAHLLRARVSVSVDSAILAAGRSLGKNGWESVGVAFFNANMLNGIGSPIVLKTTDFKTVDAGPGVSTVSLQVNTTLPVTSAAMGNISSWNIAVSATAQRRSLPAEVVMVLDNTGSMLTNNNIGALRADAQLLVNTLANGSSGALSNVTIGIVPYAASVNPGATTSGYVTSKTFNPSGGLDWKGCLIEPAGAALQDAVSSASGWLPYYAPNDVDNDYTPGKLSTVKDGWGNGNASTGPNVGCPTPITPLTNNVATLNNALGAMQAWSRGGTISDIGLAWGLRVLSPGAPFTGGGAFGANANKILVMMTDGEAGFYKLDGNNGDNVVNSNVISDYAGYGRVDQYGLLGVSGAKDPAAVKKMTTGQKDAAKTAAKTAINANITSVCNTLRALNVRVYTITFGGLSTDTKNIYTNCAYKPSYWHDAASQAELETAFKSIAGDILELTIVK